MTITLNNARSTAVTTGASSGVRAASTRPVHAAGRRAALLTRRADRI